MFGMGIRHRIFAALLSIGILALLASTISLVINEAVRSPSPNSTATLPANAKPLSFTYFLSSYIKHGNKITPSLLALMERPYITFTAASLDPTLDELSGTLSVTLPPGLPPLIRDAHGKSVFQGSGTTPYPQYANDKITVSLLVTNTPANKEDVFSIPLKNFSAGSNLGLHEFPFTIPLNGFSGSYPQDVYSTTLTIALSLPAGWTPNINTGAHALVHTVDGGTVENAYNFNVKPTPASFNELESNAPDTFQITISRNWYNEFFVFAVAVIPILFALLFFHLLFVAGGKHGIGRSFEHFTEALVVSILSVLPLRVVLVPGDITGLTRVDLVLGIGLVLIVTVAAGKYAIEVWTTGAAEGVRGEGDHAFLHERWDAVEHRAEALHHAHHPEETPAEPTDPTADSGPEAEPPA